MTKSGQSLSPKTQSFSKITLTQMYTLQQQKNPLSHPLGFPASFDEFDVWNEPLMDTQFLNGRVSSAIRNHDHSNDFKSLRLSRNYR